MSNPFRALPSISQLLEQSALVAARSNHSPEAITAAARVEVDALRTAIAAENTPELDLAVIAERIAGKLDTAALPTLRTVINATGIVLHTNLGRSPLHPDAAAAAFEAGRSYLNLELDLATGKRSCRQDAVRAGICAITGAECATAVNNCAAATVIVLRSLAAQKEVIVSRGQLIEIGGSFRIPDIMAVSSATLREVGTTNITRLRDYEQAIGPNTAAIMRIHTSNYRVRGFTKSVELSELVALGRKHNIPVIDDTGSGQAVDLTPFGFPGEPLVSAGIAAGADLVLFSGDKLLGGPQAGIIAGKASHIAKIERDPLMRAFRLDKMTLAALEATLRLYRDPVKALREIPTLRMLTTPLAELQQRCEAFAARLRELPGVSVEVRSDVAYVGGGSLPDVAIPTAVIALAMTRRNGGGKSPSPGSQSLADLSPQSRGEVGHHRSSPAQTNQEPSRESQMPHLAPASGERSPRFAAGEGHHDPLAPTTTPIIPQPFLSEAELAAKLRLGTPAVVGRVQDGKVLLDLRAVFPRQEEELFVAIRNAVLQ